MRHIARLGPFVTHPYEALATRRRSGASLTATAGGGHA